MSALLATIATACAGLFSTLALKDEAKWIGVARYRLVAVGLAVTILVTIVWLIKKGRLRGEHAWLWLVTAFAFIALAAFNQLLADVADVLGITPPSTALFFFGLIFLTTVCVEFSVRLSLQSEQIKNLAQKLAILEAEQRAPPGDARPRPDGGGPGIGAPGGPTEEREGGA